MKQIPTLRQGIQWIAARHEERSRQMKMPLVVGDYVKLCEAVAADFRMLSRHSGAAPKKVASQFQVLCARGAGRFMKMARDHQGIAPKEVVVAQEFGDMLADIFGDNA